MKVALIGLPNVGKSTLFNRLTEKRTALETAIPGTTRDRKRDSLQWNGVWIELIDAPGIKIKNQKSKIKSMEGLLKLEHNIQLQAQRALAEADALLYLIDFKTGAVAEDFEIIKKLRKNKNKPTILVVNKADKQSDKYEVAQYEKLGLGEPIPVSAANGRGTRALLNELAALKTRAAEPPFALKKESGEHITLALVGRPNVGKSSLFNALLKEEAVVVSPLPHTTRDTNNTELDYKDYTFTIVDTAGLRKKARIYESDVIEIFSIKKTLETIKKADIALLIIDANDAVSTQDCKIGNLITESKSGCVIIANKWDLVPEKTSHTLTQKKESLYRSFKSLHFAPIVFTDVKNARAGKLYGAEEKYIRDAAAPSRGVETTQPLHKLLDIVIAIHKNRNAAFSSAQLKTLLALALKKQPPPKGEKGRRPYIQKITQSGTNPPAFTIALSTPQKLPDHYLGYIKNQLRKRFILWGTEITLKVES